MRCVGIGDCTENARSTIIDFRFNFHSLKLHFLKNCGALKRVFPKEDSILCLFSGAYSFASGALL